MSNTIRRAGLAASAVALLFVTVACGSDNDSPAADAAPSSAPSSAASSAPSSEPTMADPMSDLVG
ncbi:fasciclin domain-containing protein, partial [Kribbella deserti]